MVSVDFLTVARHLAGRPVRGVQETGWGGVGLSWVLMEVRAFAGKAGVPGVPEMTEGDCIHMERILAPEGTCGGGQRWGLRLLWRLEFKSY